jgi:hypothetical protein
VDRPEDDRMSIRIRWEGNEASEESINTVQCRAEIVLSTGHLDHARLAIHHVQSRIRVRRHVA